MIFSGVNALSFRVPLDSFRWLSSTLNALSITLLRFFNSKISASSSSLASRLFPHLVKNLSLFLLFLLHRSDIVNQHLFPLLVHLPPLFLFRFRSDFSFKLLLCFCVLTAAPTPILLFFVALQLRPSSPRARHPLLFLSPLLFPFRIAFSASNSSFHCNFFLHLFFLFYPSSLRLPHRHFRTRLVCRLALLGVANPNVLSTSVFIVSLFHVSNVLRVL